MKTYILTPREREIARRFIETGEKLEGYRLLLHRCRRYLPQLDEDRALIGQFIKAVEEKEVREPTET